VYFQKDTLDKNEKLSQNLAIPASPGFSELGSLNPHKAPGFQPLSPG
jgi:hypothetical protein